MIDSFEKAKEWADLSNCLSKLKKAFEKYPGPIPETKNLARRLSQCLSPDFAVIHKNALEIYRLIFDR